VTAADAAALAAAMARPLSTARLAGTANYRWPTDAELEAHYGDDYRRYSLDDWVSDDVTAEGEWRDAAAERCHDEPGDPLLDREPMNGDPWWKDGI